LPSAGGVETGVRALQSLLATGRELCLDSARNGGLLRHLPRLRGVGVGQGSARREAGREAECALGTVRKLYKVRGVSSPTVKEP
jgi:hypothetical protein